MTQDELKKKAVGPVVLLVDRLDANRQKCQAGAVISPNVAGWPEHRVVHALRQGYATVPAEAKPAVPKASAEKKKRDEKAEALI